MTARTEDDKRILRRSEIAAELLDDWRVLGGRLRTRFTTQTFVRGMTLLQQVADAAERADHHPDVDLRYTHLDVALVSHDVAGLTQRAVRLAREISAIAEQYGAAAAVGQVQVVDIGLDTWDPDEIRPFWMAVLGLQQHDAEPDFLLDKDGHTPSLWFQDTDPHEEPRQRFHLDIDVAPEVAEQRVRKALEAGGTLVSDARAPAWWVLADAHGNKCCICTSLGRD